MKSVGKMKLLPLQGALWISGLPRALPWARCFCPYRAYGAYLQNFKIQIYLLKFEGFRKETE